MFDHRTSDLIKILNNLSFSFDSWNIKCLWSVQKNAPKNLSKLMIKKFPVHLKDQKLIRISGKFLVALSLKYFCNLFGKRKKK